MFCILVIWVFAGFVFPQIYKRNPVQLSEKIGQEIDRAERERYHLFPDIKEFQSAIIYKESDSKYVIEYNSGSKAKALKNTVKISTEVFEMTRKHVQLAEQYSAEEEGDTLRSCDEAALIYNLGLKFAAETKYKISSQLFKTITSEYPQCPQALQVKQLWPDVMLLRKNKKGLFMKGGMLDQEGRPEVLVFSGYFGLWLGIATPIAFKADNAQAYAMGLLVGGPASFLVAHRATQTANISNGRGTMIMLGGHWGTWQGLGWGAVSEMDGNTVVGLGEAAGIGGIIAASVLTRNYEFSESHASITNSALPWGAWFGLIAGIMIDHEGDMIVKDMLMGSNIGILAAGIGAKNSTMPVSRVRMINLAGVLGATFGFGLDMLVEVNDPKAAFGIVGASSAAGLWLGYHLTREKGNGENGNGSGPISLLQKNRWQLSSDVKLHHKAFTRNTLIPFMQLKMSF